jgi:hypothetical protein
MIMLGTCYSNRKLSDKSGKSSPAVRLHRGAHYRRPVPKDRPEGLTNLQKRVPGLPDVYSSLEKEDQWLLKSFALLEL